MKRNAKKLLSLLLTVLLVATFIPATPAMAAATIPVTVTASATTVNVGDEVTFTVSMGSAVGTDLSAIDFVLSLPAGMTYKTGSGALTPTAISAFGWGTFLEFGYNSSAAIDGWHTSGMGEPYNGAGLNIMTFVCTASAIGSQTVTLRNLEFLDGAIQVMTTPLTPAVVTVNQPITAMDVALTAPALGATPATAVSGTGYTGTVTWSGSPTTFAPSTAYTATITVDADSFYAFGTTFTPTVNSSISGTVSNRTASRIVFTAVFSATAAKNDVSSSITFDGNSYTYNGSPRSLPVASSTDSTSGSFTYSYVGSGGTNYPTSVSPPTNAGVYTVTATYESDTALGTKTATLTITQITLTITGVTTTNRDYDGSIVIALSNGSLVGVLSGDTGDVDFNLGNGAVATSDVGTSLSVTTNITLTGSKSGNYSLTQPTSLAVNISQADLIYSVTTTQNIKVGSGLSAITVAPSTATGIGGATVTGTLAWYSNSGRTVAAVNTDLSDLAIDGTITLYWRFTPSSTNYLTQEGETTFTIVDGDPQPMTFATQGTLNRTYGAQSFTNAATHTGGSATKGAISYSSDNTSVATVIATTGAVTIVGAGIVVISATAAAVPGLWAVTTESYTLVVSKATPVAADFDFTLPGTITFDAAAHSVTVAVKSGLTGFGSISSVVYNGSATAPTNAGTYTLAVDVAVGSNYNAGTVVLGTFVISPKPLTNSMLTITGTYVYDGTAQTPTYTLMDGGAISTTNYTVTTLPSQTNAGSYALVVTGMQNYSGTATQNFVIGKLTPTLGNLTVNIPATSEYNGQSRVATVTAGPGLSGLGVVTILYDGYATAPNDAGSYTVTANITEGSNYSAVSALSLGTLDIDPKSEVGVDRVLFVKSELEYTYEFNLTRLLPAGVSVDQVTGYTYGGSTGDAIIDGTPSIVGTTLSVSILDTALDSEQAVLTISFVSNNYDISDATITVNVVDQVLVDVTGVIVTSRAYDGTAIDYNDSALRFTDTITGDEITDLEPIYTWSSGSAPKDAGNYMLTISADGGTVYVITPQEIDFIISKAQLTLIADDMNITQNTAIPDYTFTVTGLVAPDTWESISASDPFIDSPLADVSIADAYPIIISGGSLDSVTGANYMIFAYTEGVLTVTSTASGYVPSSTLPANDGAVSVSYTRQGDTATLQLPSNKVNEIIDNAQNGIASLNLSRLRGITNATIPTAALDQIVTADLPLEIKMPNGTISLDNDALESLVSQAGANVTVSLNQLSVSSIPAEHRSLVRGSDVVFDISIMSGTQQITGFDGTITITVPYNGPLPAAVWHLSETGELTKLDCVYDAVTGTVTFSVNHLSIYLIGEDTDTDDETEQWVNPFIDVSVTEWFYPYVEFVVSRGLMVGTDSNVFSPDSSLTRAMIVLILYRYEGSPSVSGLANPFSDVTSNEWYTDAVIWAAANDIVSGYGDGGFGPNDSVKRQDLAVILHRYSVLSGYALPVTREYESFADNSSIMDYAVEAVEVFYMAEIINGKTGNLFDPLGTASRAEVAAMLCRFIESIE